MKSYLKPNVVFDFLDIENCSSISEVVFQLSPVLLASTSLANHTLVASKTPLVHGVSPFTRLDSWTEPLDWTTGLQNVGSSVKLSHTHSRMRKCHTCKGPQALLGIRSLGVMDLKLVFRLGSVNKSSYM